MEYRQDGRFVFCPTARGTLGVEVVAPGILRVFLGEEARNYVSKAVEADLHEACPFMVTGAGEGCAVSTPLLRLEIDPQGHTDFYDAQGRALSLSYRGERGTVDRGLTPEALELLAKEGHRPQDQSGPLPLEELRTLLPGDAVYGLGDKTGFLNKRGYAYENWNTDEPAPHEESFKSLYKDFPVFFVSGEDAGHTYGIFFDNTFRTYFDFGFESPAYLSFGAKEGYLNYYFLAGPTLTRAV